MGLQVVERRLQFGPYVVEADVPDGVAVPYFIAGRAMYCVGMSDGVLRPIGVEHVVGEMGGVWAHPIKVAEGVTVQVCDVAGLPIAAHDVRFSEQVSHVAWGYGVAGLRVVRRDFVVEDAAAFVSLVRVQNDGQRLARGELHVSVWLKFVGCWFGGAASGGGVYWCDDGLVLGYDQGWLGRWGVACGAAQVPGRWVFVEQAVGQCVTLVYPFAIAPGEAEVWEFVLAGDHEGGHEGARGVVQAVRGRGEVLLAEKVARYAAQVLGGVTFETLDEGVNRSFALAKANLQVLVAEYGPKLGPYFLAGIPEYPQLFGCDTAYSVPGATGAGFATVVRSALLLLAGFGERACGRIPHEVTTNGRVFHPGNTQETPQFAVACWDYFRWSGDVAFLEAVYPLCCEGLDVYVPAVWGGAGRLYPIGDGVVERGGMGPYKVDSTCYVFQALGALRDMARALGLDTDAERYEARLRELAGCFERDWWVEEEGLYADSLRADGGWQLDGHWTVVLPLLVGLAGRERGRRALAQVIATCVSRWGLVHTRGCEEAVWTLPTGLLALTLFRYQEPDQAVVLLERIAETASHGTGGTFKELIPIGLCFVQLWSAALYLQGMLEGVAGLRPLAHLHELAICPQVPGGWACVRVGGLMVGGHGVQVTIESARLVVQHVYGPQALLVRYRLPGAAVVGEVVGDGVVPQVGEDAEGWWVGVGVPPGRGLQVRVVAGVVDVEVG